MTERLIDKNEALIYHYNPYCDETYKGLINDTTIFKYKTPLVNFINSYKLSKYFPENHNNVTKLTQL